MPPKAPPAHPTYEVMVKAAIVSLKERSGSSTQAIAKYLAATYKLPDGWKKVLATQVKKLVKSERLLQLKNSYKLGEALKKAPKKVVKKKVKVVKKKVVKKKAKVVKKKAAPKKKAAAKPKAAKKAKVAPKKAKAAPKKAKAGFIA
mmetsp:Transcript_43946/g.70642  ORF Transcript_43946/g.70642 Transcript_43946/m.70642 type:complete len:146 (-) Transcript_43946:471-908(-)